MAPPASSRCTQGPRRPLPGRGRPADPRHQGRRRHPGLGRLGPEAHLRRRRQQRRHRVLVPPNDEAFDGISVAESRKDGTQRTVALVPDEIGAVTADGRRFAAKNNLVVAEHRTGRLSRPIPATAARRSGSGPSSSRSRVTSPSGPTARFAPAVASGALLSPPEATTVRSASGSTRRPLRTNRPPPLRSLTTGAGARRSTAVTVATAASGALAPRLRTADGGTVGGSRPNGRAPRRLARRQRVRPRPAAPAGGPGPSGAAAGRPATRGTRRRTPAAATARASAR